LNLNVIHLIAHQKQLPLIVPVSTIFPNAQKNEYQMAAPVQSGYAFPNAQKHPIFTPIVSSTPEYSQPQVTEPIREDRKRNNQQYPGANVGPEGAQYDTAVPISYPQFGQRKPSLNLGYNQLIVDSNPKQSDHSVYPALPPLLPLPEIPASHEPQIEQQPEQYKQQPEQFQQQPEQSPKYPPQPEQFKQQPEQAPKYSQQLEQEPQSPSKYSQQPEQPAKFGQQLEQQSHYQQEYEQQSQYSAQPEVSKQVEPQVSQYSTGEQPANYERPTNEYQPNQYQTTSAPQIVQQIDSKENYQPPINQEQPAFASFLSNLPVDLFNNYNQSDALYTQNVNVQIPTLMQQYEDATPPQHQNVHQQQPIDSNKGEREQYVEQQTPHQSNAYSDADKSTPTHGESYQPNTSGQSESGYGSMNAPQAVHEQYPPNRPYEAHRLQPIRVLPDEQHEQKSNQQGHQEQQSYEPPVQVSNNDVQRNEPPQHSNQAQSSAEQQVTLSQLQQVHDLIASVRNSQNQAEGSSSGYGQRLTIEKSESSPIVAEPQQVSRNEKSDLLSTEIGLVRRRWRAQRRVIRPVQTQAQPSYRAAASEPVSGRLQKKKSLKSN
jgi:hypothetical protein